MTALVQQLGRAPRERWRLFEQYFSYTYNREIERDTYASPLLSRHRGHIEKIHARIALILQVESESEGGAVGITKQRLEEVIETVLAEDEIPGDRIRELVKDISKAAEERLVFLVEPEPGKFGFEIRSLQEFMAAHALTSGREIAVENRLRQIAKASMFRNTLLFCASRFFSDGSALRDIFEDICDDLDSSPSDTPLRLSRAGALLALEGLEEGAVITQPKRARTLLDKAANLLTLPPSEDHKRLVQAAGSDIFSPLEEKLRTHFSLPADSRKFNEFSVWICLLEAVAKKWDWALALVENHKNELPLTSSFFEAAADCELPIGLWFATQIEALPSTALIPFFSYRWMFIPEADNSWLSYLNSVLGVRSFSWRRRHHGSFNPLSFMPKKRSEPAYAEPSNWQHLRLIGQFEHDPNTATLAAALHAVSDLRGDSEVEFLMQRTSWPLAFSIWACDDQDGYIRLAEEMTAGKCGDVVDWNAWEQNWLSQECDLVLALESLREHPFNISYRAEVPFLTELPIRMYIGGKVSSAHRRLYEFSSQRFSTAIRKRERVVLADACLASLKLLPIRTPRSHFQLSGWISFASEAALHLAVKPNMMRQNEWLDALDKCPSATSSPWLASFERLVVGLEESDYHPLLLRNVLNTISIYSIHFFSREDTLIDTIMAAGETLLLKNAWQREGRAGGDAALLILVCGISAPNLDGELFQRAAKEADLTPSYWLLIAGAIVMSRLESQRLLALACLAFELASENFKALTLLLIAIKRELQKRVSELMNPVIWDRVVLPLPRPRGALTESDQVSGANTPVSLKSLTLTDVSGIDHLDVEFAPPSAGFGQWIVILGPNGIGKTTILKSIAVATRNVRDPAIWPKGAFPSTWIRLPNSDDGPTVEANIKLELGDGTVQSTIIRESINGLTINQSPEISSTGGFRTYAYGCRRGSALSGGPRAVNIGDDDGPEIATLFDPSANLIHAETWLVALDGDASKNKRSKLILDAVFSALKDLLLVDSLEIRDQRVWLSVDGSPSLPLSALSDGYLTSAGWFLDLVSRWVKNATATNFELKADFMSQMTGLVLIDEIDLHLHPRWQIEVIARTRQLLPKMSFVVTTHNPLTLVGAKSEEIWVLARGENRTSISQGAETPALLSGGQLYRRYFGIEDVFPSEIGRAVERFGFLVGQTLLTPEEKSELEKLRATLLIGGFISEEFSSNYPNTNG